MCKSNDRCKCVTVKDDHWLERARREVFPVRLITNPRLQDAADKLRKFA